MVLSETDSTNAEATRIAPSLSGPTWILAIKQTAGRGRRGRAWVDPIGNFAATLVMRPTETPDKIALRSFTASLALYDTFVALTGRPAGFALKWPNDVLLNGGKIAGILLENLASSHLAIGIGVNLKQAPSPAEIDAKAVAPVSLLSETGADISPEDFLDTLAPKYAHWEHQLITYGFAPIREAWLSRAARLGQPITARTTKTEITGTFETIDATGQLVLSTAKGRQTIPAADIFF
ncbi:MAG: biotin--[acetyl-CoA-carboxylase] ligase [Paracoccaceae bacterium]